MTLEGGGGGAPPPDPRLVEAQIKSMGIQDNAIQEMLAMQKEMQPLQKQQLQFSLEADKKAYEQSQADRVYGLERRDQLTKLQNKQIQDAADFNVGSRSEELANQAIADVGIQTGLARTASAQAMARRGVMPGTGQSIAATNALDAAEAATKTGAAQVARAGARQEGYSLTDRATNSLSGYPNFGLNTTNQGSDIAGKTISNINASVAGRTNPITSAAQIAGSMGANATNMYNTQAQTWASRQNSGDQITQGLLGMGAAYLMKPSDRRLKENIDFVKVDKNTNLNIYKFNYKDDPEIQYEGVMADEVIKTYPDAVLTNPHGFMSVNYKLLGIEFKKL